MLLNGLVAIHGTTGLKATGWGQDLSQRKLIQTDYPHRQDSHTDNSCFRKPVLPAPDSIGRSSPSEGCQRKARWSNWTSATSVWENVATDRGGRAIKTQSHPFGIELMFRRVVSRSKRLTLFRRTAPPTRLLTTNPKRLTSSSLGTTARTSNRCAQERPFRRTRAKSELRLSRCLRFIDMWAKTDSGTSRLGAARQGRQVVCTETRRSS